MYSSICSNSWSKACIIYVVTLVVTLVVALIVAIVTTCVVTSVVTSVQKAGQEHQGASGASVLWQMGRTRCSTVVICVSHYIHVLTLHSAQVTIIGRGRRQRQSWRDTSRRPSCHTRSDRSFSGRDYCPFVQAPTVQHVPKQHVTNCHGGQASADPMDLIF